MERNWTVPPGSIPSATMLITVAIYVFGGLDKHELTAVSNAIWGLGALGAALLAHRVLRARFDDLNHAARELCFGVRMAGGAVFLHRLWSNFGIWFRDEGGNYWSFTTDHRWVTAVLVAFIARGSQRAAAPYVRAYFASGAAMFAESVVAVLSVCAGVLA